jgi:ABC-2 type transport system ATP-binding protein/lipopolysaccharide transport system ATP-binding protein
MAHIELRDASVEFAIYNARGRSLRRDLLRRVGGRVGSGDRDRVTIQALRNIDLTIRSGDRVAIVGHNGAGKSTLLRVMSGAYEPSTGTSLVEGKVSSLLDMTMGMDFELTGRQNIILRAVFLGMSFAQAESLVPEIAEFSELGSYIDLPMRTYSSGMVLRLAFGVSTAIQPDIILLDEMIGVGDASFADRAQARLNHFLSNASILVLASHAAATVRKYCTRGLLLEEGRLVADGDIDRVLEMSGSRSS